MVTIYQSSSDTWWTNWFQYNFVIKTDEKETYLSAYGAVVETTDCETMDDEPKLKTSKFEVTND